MTLRENCIEQTQWLGASQDFRTFIPRHAKRGRKGEPIGEQYADVPLVPEMGLLDVYSLTAANGARVYAYLAGNITRKWSENVDDLIRFTN